MLKGVLEQPEPTEANGLMSDIEVFKLDGELIQRLRPI